MAAVGAEEGLFFFLVGLAIDDKYNIGVEPINGDMGK